jgi:excisionase family DNA binding protein
MTAQREIPRRAWNPREVAEALGVPYDTVLWLIHNDKLGHVVAGRYYLVPDIELQRYLSAGVKASAA